MTREVSIITRLAGFRADQSPKINDTYLSCYTEGNSIALSTDEINKPSRKKKKERKNSDSYSTFKK